jgi:hypothetical protein
MRGALRGAGGAVGGVRVRTNGVAWEVTGLRAETHQVWTSGMFLRGGGGGWLL